LEALVLGLTKVCDSNAINDLKWQLCSLLIREPLLKGWTALLKEFSWAKDVFFESLVLQLAGQFPLPTFNSSRWNSLPNDDRTQQPDQNKIKNIPFAKSGNSILR
jgi:hypothetical protein